MFGTAQREKQIQAVLVSAPTPRLGPALSSSGTRSVLNLIYSVTHTTELTFGPSDKAKPNLTGGKA